MNRKNTKTEKDTSISVEEFERSCRKTNWDDYWQEVGAAASKEVEAYDKARAKSKEMASQHIIV